MVAEYELSLPEALGARLAAADAAIVETEDKYGRRRTLELTGEAAAALKELKASADALPLLFSSPPGRSFGRSEARRLLLATARDAGLADVSLRALRRRILLAA